MAKITTVWIHGANSSSQSFEYLREHCGFKNEYCVNYSSKKNFYDNLDQIKKEVELLGPIFLVGHSLGGLYGVHLTKYVPIVGGVSISTPFGGSFTADWAKYLIPNYPLFRDIGSRSKPVTEALEITLNIPWTQVVSTKGSVPYHGSENDGVVTVNSMTARSDVKIIQVPYNHYEVVCNHQVLNIVKDKYFHLTQAKKTV